jgi:hypothetical protein
MKLSKILSPRRQDADDSIANLVDDYLNDSTVANMTVDYQAWQGTARKVNKTLAETKHRIYQEVADETC